MDPTGSQTERKWTNILWGALGGIVIALVVWTVGGIDADPQPIAASGELIGGGTVDGGFEGTVLDRPAAQYYLDSCAGCHGTDRRGATGPALLPERLTQDDAYGMTVPGFPSAMTDA